MSGSEAENVFLRKQLALRRASDATRFSLTIVKPETFLGWHRLGFRLLWRWKSRPRGRPLLPQSIQKLIRRMAQENPIWGEERIASELLLKLHIRVSDQAFPT
jgi:hypothetical protein